MIPELKTKLGSSERNIKDVREIIIHHTAAPVEWTIWTLSDADYKRLYVSNGYYHSNHFKDGREVFYAYHWLIHPDGTTEKMLNDDEIGWHAGNWDANVHSIAIAFAGDYSGNPPSDAAIKAAASIIKQYNLPYRFHRDVVPTICPGNWDRSILNDAIVGIGHSKIEYDFQLLNQGEHPSLLPGETTSVSFLLKNSGKLAWNKGEFKLGTSGPKDRPSLFYNSDWIGVNRACTVNKEVAGGEETILDVSLTAPKNINPGKYKEYFCPLIEGTSWMKDIGIYIEITIPNNEKTN